MTKPLFILSLLLFVIFSCKRHDIRDDINNMLDSYVKLDSGNMVKINGNHNQAKYAYTLVRFFDKKECQSCAITKLHGWDSLMDSTNQKLTEKCSMLFVLTAPFSEVANLEILIRSQKTDYDMFVDTANIFCRDNPFIVDNPMLHTFLIDNKKGKIVLVGSPLDNKDIRKMMLDKITSQNN